MGKSHQNFEMCHRRSQFEEEFKETNKFPNHCFNLSSKLPVHHYFSCLCIDISLPVMWSAFSAGLHNFQSSKNKLRAIHNFMSNKNLFGEIYKGIAEEFKIQFVFSVFWIYFYFHEILSITNHLSQMKVDPNLNVHWMENDQQA